ncbi:hypothetical protein GmHk_08G021887 [Glycine max]|nr:hypothetical protein GmHk_08G021887 [Glycine max]
MGLQISLGLQQQLIFLISSAFAYGYSSFSTWILLKNFTFPENHSALLSLRNPKRLKSRIEKAKFFLKQPARSARSRCNQNRYRKRFWCSRRKRKRRRKKKRKNIARTSE